MKHRSARHFTYRLSVVLLGLVAGPPAGDAAAQDPVDLSQDLPQRVAALVTLLTDQDEAIRDDAERQLVELGTPVLPFLPRSSTGITPDHKLRLARIRIRINRHDLEESVLPSYVTLMGEMRLEEALEAIEHQTGNRLIDVRDRSSHPSPAGPLQLQLDHVPFWQAVNTLLQRSDTQLDASVDRPNTLAMRPRTLESPESVDDQLLSDGNSILRGEVIRVTRVNEGNRIPMDTLRLDLDVLWEPRFSPLEIRFRNSDLSAKDDLGNTLRPISSTGQATLIHTDRSGGFQPSWQFEVPSDQAIRLQSLSAEFDMLLPGPVVTFSFPNLPRPIPTRDEQLDISVSLHDIRSINRQIEIRLLVEYRRDSPAFESHRVWIYDCRVDLTDGDGVVTKPQSMELWLQQGRRFGLSYRFDLSDVAGQTFQIAIPRTFFLARIPLEFHDIPLR